MRRHDSVALAAGVTAGLLIALAAPPFGWWPLGIIGLGILSSALTGAHPSRRLLVGAGCGIAQYAVGALFVAAFTLAGYVLLVGLEGLLCALFALLASRGALQQLRIVGAVILLEWARDHWPVGGMPIGGVAIGQSGGPLLALTRIGGPLLMVAAAAALGAGGASSLGRRYRSRHPPRLRDALGGLGSLGGVALAVTLASVAPNGSPEAGSLRAAIVQGGGRRGLTSLEQPVSTALAATIAETSRVAPRRVAVVLWPEDVVSLGGPLAGSPAERALGALAHHLDATLLAGVTALVGQHQFTNALVAITPNGRIAASDEKAHPVPFGEYVPFRGVLQHVVNLAAVPRDMVVGHGSGLLRTPAGPLGALISYEDFFPGRGRSAVRAGGRALVVATNTASYATSEIPGQELAASRIQAVAEGRYLLQAATVGVSAVIAPSGAVLWRSELGVPATLTTTIPLRRGATLYEQFGNVPTLGLAALALATGVPLLAVRRRRRQRRHDRVAALPARALAANEEHLVEDEVLRQPHHAVGSEIAELNKDRLHLVALREVHGLTARQADDESRQHEADEGDHPERDDLPPQV